MAAPDERAFVVFNRGIVRDQVILANFRNELRVLTNPKTGLPFTEDEIERATQPGSRFYIEADSIDLFGQAAQQRALFFVSQIDPRRANTQFLNEFHGRIWLGPNSRLPATGGSGGVLATGTTGTVIPGSAVIGDPAAAVATDPNGFRFQNLADVAIDDDGNAQLTMAGIDTGRDTNLVVDTELKWSVGAPPGVDPVATVNFLFDGGFDEETDEDYAARIEERIRNRPASGNATHFQAWAQEASVGVEQAFVYPVALNAGTVVVAVTEKRVQNFLAVEGPEARVPSTPTLIAVSNYLIAPDSPVVPQRVFVVVTGVQTQASDLVIQLSMAKGRAGGWSDVIPWPAYTAATPSPQVDSVVDPLNFTIDTDDGLPNGAALLVGADAPRFMVWNREVSRFVELDVASVAYAAGTATVILNTAPALVDDTGADRDLVVGDKISPFTDRNQLIAESVESYFDSLGPGEVVSETDSRFARAARQPRPSTEFNSRAGQAVLSVLLDALGGIAADANLSVISKNVPDLPTNIIDGPNMLTLGDFNVHPL